MRKQDFCLGKTKAQISAFVFATRIVHSLFFLIPKFQASSYFLTVQAGLCGIWLETLKAPCCFRAQLYSVTLQKHSYAMDRDFFGFQNEKFQGVAQGFQHSPRHIANE